MKLDKGINLGGYLSQCTHSSEHYKEFITKNDIIKIADFGFDHVRLPIDYNVIEDENGNAIEDGYCLLSDIVSWCKENELNIILAFLKKRDNASALSRFAFWKFLKSTV